MALIYEETHGDVNYQVRTAGASVRLYTNGAFHTQYNPNHVFTGAVWDLLTLPALCMPSSPTNVLLLGVAGGTALHQLNYFFPNTELVGIELDPQHVKLGKRFFALQMSNLNLICADALEWLNRSDEKFDYIIDDIFVHASKGQEDPVRPFPANREWHQLLSSHLNNDGVMVQNHLDQRQARTAKRPVHKNRHLIGFQTEQYTNTVTAEFREPISALRHRLSQVLDSYPKQVTSKLRHHIVKLR